MDQKTVDLIRGGSIVVGVLSLSSLLTLSVYPIASLVGIISVIAILLGLAVAYAGVQVRNLSLKTVALVFWIKLLWLVLNFLLSLMGKIDTIRLLIILVQGIIMVFLIMWLKKIHSLPSETPTITSV